MLPLRTLSAFAALAACALAAEQPVNAPLLPLDDLRAGQRGEVWTVFSGTEPEPFAVEVTGVVRNALGPGKSMILCRLTDPRVQNMGAVAGMSGSPLYVDGRLAGALSYQVQRFETVRYAGFTPAADLVEVQAKAAAADSSNAHPVAPATPAPGAPSTPAPPDTRRVQSAPDSAFRALQPVFTLSGLSPAVAEIFAPQFAALGLATTALGGNAQSSFGTAAAAGSGSLNTPPSTPNSPTAPAVPLRPGGAVSVALATGDILLAGTGTVSRLDGPRITAFGHPMLSLGEVDLPLCAAEIVTILPSNMQSSKIANTGAVIGTISQDRLSAVSGTLGPGPAMVAVEVRVRPLRGEPRTLRFAVARQTQLTPVIVAAGITQAILGTNDAGFTHGFRLRSEIVFPASAPLTTDTLHAGTQGFQQGLNAFALDLAATLQNPFAKQFPDRVAFTVEPLAENPTVTFDRFQLSRTTVRPGETVQATLAWRDWQGAAHHQTIDLPIDRAWAGRTLEVLLAPGRVLDDLTGHPRTLAAAQLRSFPAYLAALRDDRPTDGLFLALLEKADLLTDQIEITAETPGSIERIARTADETRFKKLDSHVALAEHRVLQGKLANIVLRRPLRVVE